MSWAKELNMSASSVAMTRRSNAAASSVETALVGESESSFCNHEEMSFSGV